MRFRKNNKRHVHIEKSPAVDATHKASNNIQRNKPNSEIQNQEKNLLEKKEFTHMVRY
jgi:hypothetical protein